MNVLITGAGGFIGLNLIKYIEKSNLFSNDKIIILGNREYEKYVNIEHSNYRFTKEQFTKKDIYNIDVLIHLGAFIPKSRIDVNNIDKSFSNLKNTITLLQNIPGKPKKVIFTSTIDVYENTNDKIDELTKTDPISLYGWSKLICEKFIEEYGVQNNVIVQILRIGHIYGNGEEKYQKLIPISIKNAIQGKDLQLNTNSYELRSFLHVKDCCKCILKSTELNYSAGPINVVSKQTIAIKDLLERIIEISKKNLSIQINEQSKNTRNLSFKNDKMIQLLCQESINFEEGLAEEYGYMKNIFERNTHDNK